MTTYALVIYFGLFSAEVIETGLTYEQCTYAENTMEMETGEDLDCIPTYET